MALCLFAVSPRQGWRGLSGGLARDGGIGQPRGCAPCSEDGGAIAGGDLVGPADSGAAGDQSGSRSRQAARQGGRATHGHMEFPLLAAWNEVVITSSASSAPLR